MWHVHLFKYIFLHLPVNISYNSFHSAVLVFRLVTNGRPLTVHTTIMMPTTESSELSKSLSTRHGRIHCSSGGICMYYLF